MWREARAVYKLSTTDKLNADKHIREGYELITKALELDENNHSCHKWMSILLDARSELDGIKARVGQLWNVKKHMKKAVELNPDDPINWHFLGYYSFGLADMAWYQRAVVSAVFTKPPSGTYEEALELFLKAEDTKPGFSSTNLLLIGKCYHRLNDKEKAREFWTKASKVPIR